MPSIQRPATPAAFARSVVSTDDPAVAAEARAHGAEVIDRPPELSLTTSSQEQALWHAVQNWPLDAAGYVAVAMLRPTSPFTRSQDIDRAMEPILAGDADATLTVVDDYGYFWTKGDDGWRMYFQTRVRHQDRTPWKRESGNVYGVRYGSFLKTGKLFSGRVQPVTVSVSSWLDINGPRDLAIAEVLEPTAARAARGRHERGTVVAAEGQADRLLPGLHAGDGEGGVCAAGPAACGSTRRKTCARPGN